MTTASTLLQKMLDAMLGAQPSKHTNDAKTDPLPEWATDSNTPPKVKVERLTPPLKRNEIAPEALKQAMENFLTEEVAPYAKYNPATKYRLDQITTYFSASNKAILSDLESLKRIIRNGIAKTCVSQVPGAANLLEVTDGCEWKIEPAPDASSDDRGVYTVLAGNSNGPEQVQLTFVFFGDYIPVEPATVVAHAEPAAKQGADQTATFEWLPPEGKTETTPFSGQPILRLRITEADQPSRKVDVTSLPLLFGRGSACGLQLHSGYISRIHGCIRADLNGQIVLESNTAKGLELHTSSGGLNSVSKSLKMGETIPLPYEGSFTLAAAAQAVDGATHIEFEQVYNAVDTQATLNVASDSTTQLKETGQRAKLAKQLLDGMEYGKSYVPMPLAIDFGAGGDAPATFCFSSDSGNPADSDKLGAKALARLWVCHADGSVSSDMIYELPHTVGRQPTVGGNATTVRDPGLLASREHLLIEKLQGGAFLTENIAYAPGKGGTWRKTRAGREALGKRFIWQPGQPGMQGSQDDWLELGHHKDGAGMNSGIVQVRIERVL